MKTQLDQIVLKQIEASERQMLQNQFNIGSIQHVFSENRGPIPYVFWFDSVWIWYIENTALIFRDDINFNRYYTEYTIKIKPPRMSVY